MCSEISESATLDVSLGVGVECQVDVGMYMNTILKYILNFVSPLSAPQDSKPVKYGQCWMFPSILVSALRFLGIPARGVTNFRSGNDYYREGVHCAV